MRHFNRFLLYIVLPILFSFFYLPDWRWDLCVILVVTNLKIILNYLFSNCSQEIAIKTSNNQATVSVCETTVMMTVRIYKLRFSQWRSFAIISELCQTLGIDAPVYIPAWMIRQILPHHVRIGPRTEGEVLRRFIEGLYVYKFQISGMPCFISEADIAVNAIKKQLFRDIIIATPTLSDDGPQSDMDNLFTW